MDDIRFLSLFYVPYYHSFLSIPGVTYLEYQTTSCVRNSLTFIIFYLLIKFTKCLVFISHETFEILKKNGCYIKNLTLTFLFVQQILLLFLFLIKTEPLAVMCFEIPPSFYQVH